MLNPNVAGFTWDKPDGSLSSRIDLIGCPYSWAPLVNSAYILPRPFSDNSSVLLHVSIPEVIPHGSGKWKLNIGILKDSEFVTAVKSFWANWHLQKPSFSSVQDWWDRGEENIKGIALKHCCQKSRERSQLRSLLANLASHLKSRVDAGHVSCLNVLESVKSQIASIDLIAAQGAKVCSRIQWAEEGELSSSFFCLEKKNSSQISVPGEDVLNV